ncbi:MAG: indole-3-glycerol phosphate synthase TrpC [Pseudomonadota bacterium]
MGKDILSQIVAHKKQEVATARQRIPEARIRERAMIPRNRRHFLKRLEHPGDTGVNIIAEIKRASPSKGVLCRDLDPALFALEYEKGGAAALSVLTDQDFFKGSSRDLQSARETTSLPVLRKDFLISSYQLYESAVMGADAVLLIVRILEQQQLHDYLDICDELKMDALVEIHTEKDLETATKAGAKLIGINNRNLSSFETDIETAIKMKSLLEPHQIAVAASGIRTRTDVEKNQTAGIWNFLIGESLVKAQNPQAFLKSLQGKK